MKTYRHVSLLKRYFSNFSVFDKLKDTQISGVNTSSSNVAKEESETDHESATDKKEILKRKPSKKVIQLVDDILNLTLIEAADLCELCQEKLEGNKNFNNSQFVNRSPFPHPSSFFGTTNWNGSIPPGGFNPLGFNPLGMQQLQQNVAIGNIGNSINSSSSSSSSSSMQGQTTEQGGGKENEKGKQENKEMEKGKEKGKGKEESQQKKNTKSTFGVKLEKFDPKNKINTIKEIRKITNVGLKEAKDMVESAPVYIQKGVPAEEANEMKKKFEALGATIILD